MHAPIVPPLLKIEVGAVYITPSGRRCYWRPGPPSDVPTTLLAFEYFGSKLGDGFTMTPANVQRLLRREGTR
jgi:hypothetical protein